MQDDNSFKLEKVLLKIAFIPLSHIIDLTVSDYNILNRATGSEIVTVAYNNGINLHQLCRNEMEIVNYHNAKKKDKILRKIKALKAKLKSSPANRRISVYPICSEPVAHNLASSSCVENMVESHIQEESSEARNLTNFQNVYTEFSYPAADIENVGKEYSNINISASINEIQIPSLTGVNLSDINSIDDIIPPRVEVGFEESAVRPPELITPNANDFGNAELEDILSLGFDQNIISSFGKGKQTNYESTEVLHHSSDLLPRSSMRQDLATPDNLLHGDGLQQSIEKSISRQSLQISTQLSPVNYQILENTSVVLPEYHRTPIALAASSFIIPPFSGIEEDEEYSPTDGPPNEAHSLSNANSRRQLVFNNIQESLPDRALPQRRKRRVQKVNDNCTDILNSVDDIMLLHNILIISESILIIPHKNPSDLKKAQINDIDLTFEFDLLKISKEITFELSQSNLPAVPFVDDTGLSNFIDNNIQQQRPTAILSDIDEIHQRPSTTLPNIDEIHQRPSTTLPNIDKIHQRPSLTIPTNNKLQQQSQISTPANYNNEGILLSHLAQPMATVDHSDEQTLLDKITPFQKRDITSKNIFATTRISNIYDEPEGIRRMTMNTSNQIADISQHFEHYNVDNQRNASRFSDLCEVQIPQYEEELVSTENMNRQRFVPRINELPSSQVLKPPGKDIIYRGQKYIQFENGLKLSIYFLELTYLFYEIQKLFSKNKVHTMDSDDVIQYLKDDKITVQCLKIRLLNLCQNKLISITDDAEREIAYINIPFFEETDEYDSLFKATV